MSRSPLIPNCLFYSRALPLCAALFCAFPSLCAAGGMSLDVASLGLGKSSGSPASPAAHLWLSGTPPHPSAASTHRRAWKGRQVVPSWVHGKLGFKNNLSMFSFHVGYKSIRGTGQGSLCIFISEWKSHSYSAALGQWLHVPLMQTSDWIYPMGFPEMQNWVILGFEIDPLLMDFIWENHVIFGLLSALKWQQFFYIPQQSQRTVQ